MAEHVPDPADEPDEATRPAARHVDDATRPVDRTLDDEATQLADRTARRRGHDAVPPRPGHDKGIAHGRADTPRSASVPGGLAERAVYRPRAGETAPPILRAPVEPPTAAARTSAGRGRPRRRRGVLASVIVGSAAVIGAAVVGIVSIIQGGF